MMPLTSVNFPTNRNRKRICICDCIKKFQHNCIIVLAVLSISNRCAYHSTFFRIPNKLVEQTNWNKWNMCLEHLSAIWPSTFHLVFRNGSLDKFIFVFLETLKLMHLFFGNKLIMETLLSEYKNFRFCSSAQNFFNFYCVTSIVIMLIKSSTHNIPKLVRALSPLQKFPSRVSKHA